MSIYLNTFCILVGLLMYALCASSKLQEVGRILFAFGLLAFLLTGDRLLSVIAR